MILAAFNWTVARADKQMLYFLFILSAYKYKLLEAPFNEANSFIYIVINMFNWKYIIYININCDLSFLAIHTYYCLLTLNKQTN